MKQPTEGAESPQTPGPAVSCSQYTSASSKHQVTTDLTNSRRGPAESLAGSRGPPSRRCSGCSAAQSPGVRLQETGERHRSYGEESGEACTHQSQARRKNWAVISQCVFPGKRGDSFSGLTKSLSESTGYQILLKQHSYITDKMS